MASWQIEEKGLKVIFSGTWVNNGKPFTVSLPFDKSKTFLRGSELMNLLEVRVTGSLGGAMSRGKQRGTKN